jgi:uncharacterized protein (TIGR00288 family)
MPLDRTDARVAVLVDCDNVPPAIIGHALRFAAQFGRVVVRRGYGNKNTIASGRWQDTLVQEAFTPCLQYQYASGKNTADIALALDALELLFDERVETICLVTSDSDFAYLCRKLRERAAQVCIVGEPKTPDALRNASDHFSEWLEAPANGSADADATSATAQGSPAARTVRRRPLLLVEAVRLMAGTSPDGRVDLGALGNYLRRTDPAFTTKAYGHSGLLEMLRTYDLLKLTQAPGGHWAVELAGTAPRMDTASAESVAAAP